MADGKEERLEREWRDQEWRREPEKQKDREDRLERYSEEQGKPERKES